MICLYRFTRDYAAFDLYYADDNIRDVIVLIMSFFDDHASLFAIDVFGSKYVSCWSIEADYLCEEGMDAS